MADGVIVKWDLQKFFAAWSQLKRRSTDAGRFFIRWQARRLVKALAFHTPIAAITVKVVEVKLITDRAGVTRYVRRRTPKRIRLSRGRARAGFKPAAAALGAGTVYTGFPNKGEGFIIDASNDLIRPTITIVNRVPYILLIPGHGEWAQAAINQEAARLLERLEKSYRQNLIGFVR